MQKLYMYCTSHDYKFRSKPEDPAPAVRGFAYNRIINFFNAFTNMLYKAFNCMDMTVTACIYNYAKFS